MQKKHIHIFILLLLLALLASMLTYLVPAGSFQRVLNEASGQNFVVANSYERQQQSPIPPWLIPVKLVETLFSANVIKLVSFVVIIGGTFEIILQSGAISALLGSVLPLVKKRRQFIIPVFICVFSVFGFTMGLSTASIIFVPIGIAVARALGYDAITGMAMVMLGTNAGFAAGIYNPFSVGVAQTIAELPLYSGAWIRWIILFCLLPLTAGYILKRANKQNNPLINAAVDGQQLEDIMNTGLLTKRMSLVLFLLFAALTIVICCVSFLQWSTPQISVVFLILAAIAGPVAGMGLNKTCDTFDAGCRKMMKGVIIICLAATIRSILTDGLILDTIAYFLIGTIIHLPRWAQLLGMFYANVLVDPILTSATAHASVAMPIMTPMADALSLTRQSAVLAFQLGDGLVNLISPISTTLTSCLAITGISYSKWLRYFLPLVGLYLLLGTTIIILAGVVGY